MAEDVGKRLLSIKKQIDDAKIEKAQIEGAIAQNMKRLKEDFGVSTLERAKKKLDKLAEEEQELQTKLDTAIDKLEEEYDWD